MPETREILAFLGTVAVLAAGLGWVLVRWVKDENDGR